MVIRPLTSREDLHACVALQQQTWGNASGGSFTDAVPASLLSIVQRIGGVAAGAFDDAGALVGFVFGMTGVERGGRVVHWSDMLAVRPDARQLGLGKQLKEYQRRLVRDTGAEVIYWTYDPLIARNAHFNFNRLGARATEYVEDMYGVTDSVLHGGLPTDRLIVAWPTHDEAIAERVAVAEGTLTSTDCLQAPIATPDWIERASSAAILPHCVRVEIPSDAEALLASGADDALRWRLDTRRALQWCMGAGYEIAALDWDEVRGYYLLVKPARGANGSARA